MKANSIAGASENLNLFTALGFHWDRSAVPAMVPTYSIDRVAFHFHRMLPEFVWDASKLEGNPLTYPEVKTLCDGVTVGGRKISDQAQVLNLIKGSKHLLALVKTGQFALDKPTFIHLHSIVSSNEALDLVAFRGDVFQEGVAALDECQPFEKGVAFFLFCALQNFFFDGTSRFMMNGVLMSNGIDAISVPSEKAQDFNVKMARFHLTKDATEMMEFLVDCHPEAR